MERWGLGYDVMREIKPDIIYLSQSGMGQVGVYGRYRTVGPIAASMAGISEMSGLPEPYAPAGWGYSYLDWFGAYNLATANDGRPLVPRAHRQRPVDRLLAGRRRHLPQRHRRARLVRQWPRLAPLRQPLALQARRAARCVPLPRRRSVHRPLDRHRLLHRRRMASPVQHHGQSRLDIATSVRLARRPPRPSGSARRAPRSVDPNARTLGPDGTPTGRRRPRRRLPGRPGPLRARSPTPTPALAHRGRAQ